MNSNLVIFPLLVPLLVAIVLAIFYRMPRLQRWISAFGAIGTLVVSWLLVDQVYQKGVHVLELGGWIAPYGIVFVADMFAALLVMTAAIVGTACLFYAFYTVSEEKERLYFYPLVQFLLVGVIGSFLTGDIFNLFVCFEVMLISSYALIVLGGGKRQLRESVKYLLINILSSALFVTAIAYLYGTLGTLNMAQLSERVAEAGQGGLLTVLSILLLLVFGLKAGLFLFFWLPGSYSVPHSAVIALFGGLLTKVGVYAIMRTFTLVFYHEPDVTHIIIGILSGVTIVLGVIGAVAYKDVMRILIYNIVAAVGFILFGLAISNGAGLEGAIFYLLHDMVVKALLFLLGGALVLVAGTDQLGRMGGLIRKFPLLGWLFFVAAMALVGVPPLSGFIGKLLVLEGGLAEGWYWLSGIALASSLLILYSIMKLFMSAFWGEEQTQGERKELPRFMLASSVVLTALVVFMGLGAEWIFPYIALAAEGLSDPSQYIQAVLKE